VLADLWVVDATLIKGIPPEKVFTENGLGAFLAQKKELEVFRVYSPSYSLPRYIAAKYGLETADGVDPLYLENYDRFMEVASGIRRQHYGVTVPAMEGGATPAKVNREAVPDPALLGLLNVLYVAAEFPIDAPGLYEVARFGDTYLYKNQEVLLRAFVVGEVETVADFDRAIEFLKNHIVASIAPVEGGIPLNSGAVQAKITWLEQTPNRSVLAVQLDRPGLLVISQPWYPGWRIAVNQQEQALFRAYGLLSCTYLEAGHSMIELWYQPLAPKIGFFFSVFGAIFCLVLIASTRWHRFNDKFSR
jgi:hypothetical protein